jgi:hypothetical protein
MAQDPRVLNITRGFRLKRSQVYRAIENGAVAWVEVGVSVRDLTLAESIAARNEQARLREPLEFAEVHGLRFDPPVSGIPATRREGLLLWEAHKFVMSA